MFLLFPIFAACYFIPTLVALMRRHSNAAPVVLLNLFLGWTFIGWVVALVWSFTDNTTARRF
jgi:hypothetical protein